MSTYNTTTTRFTPQTNTTAPEGSRESLTQIEKTFGFVPNLMGTLANAPAALHAYLGLDQAFNRTTFTPAERQIIALAASVENGCAYCEAAHSTVLKGMLKVDAETVAAIRDGATLRDPKRDALVRLVKEAVQQRGHLREETITAFLAAGYAEPQLLEVLVGVALKTISNYLDHLNPVAIDAAFAAEAR